MEIPGSRVAWSYLIRSRVALSLRPCIKAAFIQLIYGNGGSMGRKLAQIVAGLPAARRAMIRRRVRSIIVEEASLRVASQRGEIKMPKTTNIAEELVTAMRQASEHSLGKRKLRTHRRARCTGPRRPS